MIPDIEGAAPTKTGEQISGRVWWTRRGYVGVAGVFVICVVIQVFIAGMAVFVRPANWSLHASFVQLFGLLLPIMLLFAFLGRLSRRLKLAPIRLFGLIDVQYITALGFPDSVVAAIHPVNALVIFVLAAKTTRHAWRETME